MGGNKKLSGCEGNGKKGGERRTIRGPFKIMPHWGCNEGRGYSPGAGEIKRNTQNTAHIARISQIAVKEGGEGEDKTESSNISKKKR